MNWLIAILIILVIVFLLVFLFVTGLAITMIWKIFRKIIKEWDE